MAQQHGVFARPRSLDELAALSESELLNQYLSGVAPAPTDLHGDLHGRMLAVRGAGRIWSALLQAFAAWRHFPWRGKSFVARGGSRGDGINRVFGDRARWFRFETFVAPSRVDGKPAFQLDYDNSHNPFFIRAVKDELRRVAPGLFLGRAYITLWGQARFALYFALSTAK